MPIDHQRLSTILKVAFEERKKLRVFFSDGKSFEFEIQNYTTSNGKPSWSIFPENLGNRKLTDAINIELISDEV